MGVEGILVVIGLLGVGWVCFAIFSLVAGAVEKDPVVRLAKLVTGGLLLIPILIFGYAYLRSEWDEWRTSVAFEKACQNLAQERILRKVRGVSVEQVALVTPSKHARGAPLPSARLNTSLNKYFLKSDRLHIHEGSESTAADDPKKADYLIIYSGPNVELATRSGEGFGRYSLVVKERASGFVLAERIDFFLGYLDMYRTRKTCFGEGNPVKEQWEFIARVFLE